MAELTEQQEQTFWYYNIRLTTVLLIIWFVTAYIISGLLAGWLYQFAFRSCFGSGLSLSYIPC
jgi:putative solute:sodium symporter small subunit